MSGPTPPIYVPGPGGMDCSPETQARRLLALSDLQARYYGGVSQVTDRNRSVTYRSQEDLGLAIRSLVGQINACTAGAWPRKAPRIYYVPQVKDL